MTFWKKNNTKTEERAKMRERGGEWMKKWKVWDEKEEKQIRERETNLHSFSFRFHLVQKVLQVQRVLLVLLVQKVQVRMVRDVAKRNEQVQVNLTQNTNKQRVNNKIECIKNMILHTTQHNTPQTKQHTLQNSIYFVTLFCISCFHWIINQCTK